MLPSSSSRIVLSSRLLPLRCTRSTAVMIMPGVQKPHCRPWFSRKASCIGCSLPFCAKPSIVSTFAPSACQAKMVQDFTALPSTWTTQAPHCEVSQPTCVPVRRSPSRRYWTSKVRASASAVTALPFTVIETFGIRLLLERGAQRPSFLTPETAVAAIRGEIVAFLPEIADWNKNDSEPGGRARSRDLGAGMVSRIYGIIGYDPRRSRLDPSYARRRYSAEGGNSFVSLWIDSAG